MQPPPASTAQRWAWDYLTSRDLAHKLAPPPIPLDRWADDLRPHRLERPGRPPALQVTSTSGKTPGSGALRTPERRARLFHTFLHHELQAAELMCWALLAFPDTPLPFRRGLLGICGDELRHMRHYGAYLSDLHCNFGDYPVRDWFWERVPGCATPAHFVATLGVGLEGGNLDHAERFARRLERAGDARGAALQRLIGREEIPHVRFALRWFRHFTGRDDFDTWRAHLPPPLSPQLMRGRPINQTDRLASGLSEAFVARLERWVEDERDA